MAEHKQFQLTVSRVDGPLFEGKASSVSVPGASGDMTVLAGHEPLISPLREGTITVVTESGEKQSFPTSGGTIEIHSSIVSILL